LFAPPPQPIEADSTPTVVARTVELVIPWTEAAAHEGEIATVQGEVVDTYKSAKVIYLNFAADYRTTFKVVIFADAWPNFPVSPETYYNGQQIQVTGKITLYRDAPQIIVEQPAQIEVLE